MKITSWTNAFGTITAILTTLSAFMVSMGCVPGAVDFAATCNIPFLPPSWMYVAAGVFGVITFVLKVMRPGGFFHSMFGGTAVIVPLADSGVGTVTQGQVNSNG